MRFDRPPAPALRLPGAGSQLAALLAPLRVLLLAARLPLLGLLGLLSLLLATAPAQAQSLFKIVDADGRVTYTDRPPPASTAKVAPVGKAARGEPEVALPLVVREPATRFPVTFYSIPDCAPCERGRDLLRKRGVPFRERSATSEADHEAWARIVGSRDAPALSVGNQMLRGFTAEVWSEWLDTAGYPRESRLPPNYVAPPAEPLVVRTPTAVPAAAAEPPRDAPATLPVEPTPGGIRF